jgi:prevent-host-death family protein
MVAEPGACHDPAVRSRRGAGGPDIFRCLLRCVAMDSRTIPQRELRNNIGEILREAESGIEFTITVRGRVVARLGPADDSDRRRVDLPARALRKRLAETPVDEDFASDMSRLRELEAPAEARWRSE